MAVGNAVAVAVAVDVEAGSVVPVGVAVGMDVSVGVAVEKSGMLVTPGIGVRVGKLGTQSNCPA